MEEPLEFSNLAGTSISQDQYIKTDYVILQNAGKFPFAICEWDHKILNLNKWIKFRKNFCKANKKVRATTALAAQNIGLHHDNMVWDTVYGPQEALVGHFPDDPPSKI